jgi:single-strand DNA-binding protein
MKNEAKATICGQLGADIEIRETKSGKKYGILNVAVNRSKKDRETNEFETRTDWFGIYVWSKSVLEDCAEHLKKGTSIRVVGCDMRTIKRPLVAEGEVVGQHFMQTINLKRKSDITILQRNSSANQKAENSKPAESIEVEEKAA